MDSSAWAMHVAINTSRRVNKASVEVEYQVPHWPNVTNVGLKSAFCESEAGRRAFPSGPLRQMVTG
jgi:hypothetical protein